MAVPGHDQRDFEFATKYGLKIKQVVAAAPGSDTVVDLSKAAFTEKGVLINSGEFDGLEFSAAFKAIADRLVEKGIGQIKVNYRLRDWGVSRQRYWGSPIPDVNSCRWQPSACATGTVTGSFTRRCSDGWREVTNQGRP